MGRAARRLLILALLAPALGGCLRLSSGTRNALADVVPIPGTHPTETSAAIGKPVCAGPEIDGTCVPTTPHAPHPATGLATALVRPEQERCPPTVLGIPGWCARF